MKGNPVAKNMRRGGGPFKTKDKEGKSYRTLKIKKELEEIDKKYIEEELKEFEEKEDRKVY